MSTLPTSAAPAAAPAPVSFVNWPYPAFCAHRGAGRLAPENTVAALRVGASFGYRMFEVDAKLSGDGVAVLMHDATLERTTDGHGRVSGLGFAALARLDAGSWHSSAFAGEAIPTLEHAARWTLAADAMLNVEIKPTPGFERETGAAIALDALAAWREASIPPLLSSFSEVALEAAREVAPALPRALLFGDLPADWLARCATLACVALDARHDALSPRVIAQAHDASLRVLAYTVNDASRARRLFDWGLDLLITDAVDRIGGRAGQHPGTPSAPT